MFITDEQVEKSLDFLRDNAEAYGRASGQVKFLDHKRKVVRGEQFLEAKGTVGEREAYAESSLAYQRVIEEYRRAETERVTLLTKLKAAEFKIEVWRSLNARNRRGHV